MFAKLFSRITESSLMEEPISVRYTFVMLLAIADPEGYVIGTDVAIARRINMPIEDFQRSISVLMAPDPHSNSKEFEGKRIILSNGERGYFIVNYVAYRDTRDAVHRRKYMREYMQQRRSVNTVLTPVNTSKPLLAQEEAEEEAEEDNKKQKEEIQKVGHAKDERFTAALTRFILASSQNHHWNPAGTTVEAWQMELERHSLDDAIGMLDFSTACGSKKPITNGDHKKKQQAVSSNGKKLNKHGGEMI